MVTTRARCQVTDPPMDLPPGHQSHRPFAPFTHKGDTPGGTRLQCREHLPQCRNSRRGLLVKRQKNVAPAQQPTRRQHIACRN
jgi:hypothetical protein